MNMGQNVVRIETVKDELKFVARWLLLVPTSFPSLPAFLAPSRSHIKAGQKSTKIPPKSSSNDASGSVFRLK